MQTGIVQRYYSSIMGRFLTPDPYKAGSGSGDPANPQSWNRYAYAYGDPVNLYDPNGLFACNPDVCGGNNGNPTDPAVGGNGNPIPDLGDGDRGSGGGADRPA
jgi:RHS repeat-associated protein